VLNIAEVGRSLSAQAWGISKKIAEVDELLLRDVEARERVIEIHPEVCFWALNGRQPLSHPKRDRDGLRERLAILSRWEPETEQLLRRVLREQRRNLVMADDVLDALSAFVTAQATVPDLHRLVGEPAVDECGLPMQMVFRTGIP
jgi:predicted RNase H-like nuclease